MNKQLVWILASIFTIVVLVAGIGPLRAGVEARFAGKIFILKKRPPSYFKTQGAFASFLRNNSMKVLRANEDNEWILRTFSIFKRKLGDYEVEMVFYDVRNGKSNDSRRFVDSFTQMTQDRNARSLEGKAVLTRPQFDANISYMVVAQSAGTELAKGYFRTEGVSQQTLDQQKRFEHEQVKMEASMRDLEAKAKKQEEDERLRAQGIDPDAQQKSEKPRSQGDTENEDEETNHPGQIDPRDKSRGCAAVPTRSNPSLLILVELLR